MKLSHTPVPFSLISVPFSHTSASNSALDRRWSDASKERPLDRTKENVEALARRQYSMELTADSIAEACTEYPDVQALSTVEEQHLEQLPESFESNNFGWRDAEWVVQWYYRRFLGAYPDAERRAVEDAYGENAFEDVQTGIATAVDAETTAEKLDALLTLEGVDVPVGSAFLQFVAPDRYIVLGERGWRVLRQTGEIDEEYPDTPSLKDYEQYLATSRAIADRCNCDLWDLYRALWVLGAD